MYKCPKCEGIYSGEEWNNKIRGIGSAITEIQDASAHWFYCPGCEERSAYPREIEKVGDSSHRVGDEVVFKSEEGSMNTGRIIDISGGNVVVEAVFDGAIGIKLVPIDQTSIIKEERNV